MTVSVRWGRIHTTLPPSRQEPTWSSWSWTGGTPCGSGVTVDKVITLNLCLGQRSLGSFCEVDHWMLNYSVTYTIIIFVLSWKIVIFVVILHDLLLDLLMTIQLLTFDDVDIDDLSTLEVRNSAYVKVLVILCLDNVLWFSFVDFYLFIVVRVKSLIVIISIYFNVWTNEFMNRIWYYLSAKSEQFWLLITNCFLITLTKKCHRSVNNFA